MPRLKDRPSLSQPPTPQEQEALRKWNIKRLIEKTGIPEKEWGQRKILDFGSGSPPWLSAGMETLGYPKHNITSIDNRMSPNDLAKYRGARKGDETTLRQYENNEFDITLLHSTLNEYVFAQIEAHKTREEIQLQTAALMRELLRVTKDKLVIVHVPLGEDNSDPSLSEEERLKIKLHSEIIQSVINDIEKQRFSHSINSSGELDQPRYLVQKENMHDKGVEIGSGDPPYLVIIQKRFEE